MKLYQKIICYLLAVIAVAFLATMICLQLPSIQTKIAGKAVSLISDKIDGKIEIESIHIKFINTIVIRGINIIDTHPFCEGAHDTLFHAEALSIRYSPLSLIAGECPEVDKLKIRDGCFNLVIDGTAPLPNNLVRIFRLYPKENPKPFPTKPIVSVKRVEFENLDFSLQNFYVPKEVIHPWNVNWSDIDVRHINLKVDDFAIRDGKFHGYCKSLSFIEKSGWRVDNITARATVGQGVVSIDDAFLNDSFGSYMDFDFRMIGKTPCYKDFVNKVCLEADIRQARMSVSTLCRVIPPMYPDSSTFALIEGRARGPVNNICADSLKLEFEDNCVSALVNGSVSGLPNVKKMRIDTHVSDIRFTTADATRLLASIAPRAHADLRSLSPGVKYTADVTTDGTLDRFHTVLRLNQGSSEGKLKADVRLNNLLSAKTDRLAFNGKINSEAFDIKPLTGNGAVSDISLDAGFELKLPFRDQALYCSLDSARIDNIHFNGRDYSGIRLQAKMDGRDADALLHIKDDALAADISLKTDDNSYTCYAAVGHANLGLMNFNRREVSIVAANAFARINRDLSNLQGNGLISDIKLINEYGSKDVDDIELSAFLDSTKYNIYLQSELANGGLYGDKNIFNAYLTSGNTQNLLGFILPGLYLEKGTDLTARRDENGCIYATLNSGRVAYDKQYVRALKANVSGPLDSLSAEIIAENIHALGFDFKRDSINLCLCDSLLAVDMNYDSSTDKEIFDGHIQGELYFHKDKGLAFKILPSFARLNGNTWKLPESSGKIKGREIDIDNFTINGEDSFVKVHGAMSEVRNDSLRAEIKNLNLASVNYLLRNDNFNFKGKLSASAAIISPFDGSIPRLVMHAMADSVMIKGMDYGKLHASSVYEHSHDRFVMNVTDTIDNRKALGALCHFSPANHTLDIDAAMDRFPFGFVSPLVESVFSDIDGYASGNVKADSKNGSMNISSPDARIDGGLLKIAFTHVPYHIDGPFRVDNDGIHLDNIRISDKGTGKGTASGGVKWKRMKDIRMDLHLNVKDMKALDIPSGTYGSVFYGNAIATGKVDITGPFNKLLLTADAKTTGPSDMHFVINDDLSASNGELLSFVDPRIKAIDPYDSLMSIQSVQKAREGGFKMKIRAEADQNFHAHLDMAGTGFAAGAGGVGKGVVNLGIDTGEGDFNILGDYTLQDGVFDFNASNIVHKIFTISDGSTIKFNGPITDTELGIRAIYNTKASISSLIADTTSVSNRRAVKCGIELKGKMTDPQIKFSIDVPDLDPTTKTAVESALNTDAKVQKQLLSLLISNSFIPDEQSGIVNNNSILYSNVSELMANQINNIFNKLNIPVDLGMNFQPSQNGENLFDVAISTQLWNNRIIIGGSIGNRQSSSSSNSAIFGDFDIEYKVTKNGAVRVKAFSHAADKYSNYLDQSQRNGIGFTWQQEFNNFCNWVKFLFMKKEEKLKIQEDEAKAKKDTEKLTIDE